MRTFSLLALVLGTVASQPFFQPGTEYEFQYQGKFLTGIPEIDSHFAGISLESKILVQTQGSENYKLALKNLRFAKFNEKLSGEGGRNWAQLTTPEPQQVPSEYQAVLESPVEFSMQNGEIRNIQVSQNEPEWSVNIKKALVSLLKVQTPAGGAGFSGNLISRGGNALPKQWKVMEQGVDGKCENTYQVTELPEYMIPEIEISGQPLSAQSCQGKKVYEILKTRDVSRCTERTAYQVAQPGQYLCPDGNCNNMWQRSSTARYLACGTSQENMELQAIVSIGELNQSLLGYNTENVVTGTKQVLKLVQERKTMTSLPQIQSPRKMEGLLYRYGSLENQSENRREQQQQLQQQSPASQQTPFSLNEYVLSKVSPATLQQKIVERISAIVQDLHNVEEFARKQVAVNVLASSKAFSLLTTEQMKALYQKVQGLSLNQEEKETARQVFVEMAVMSGTSPAVMLVKELIQSGELSQVRAGVSLVTLPHFIRTPTVKLLNQLFELIQSPAVTGSPLLKANAELAFATIVNKACIDQSRYTRFPIFVYGEFCNSQTSEITSKYIPYFVNEMKSGNAWQQETAILNLGTLGHESVLPILLPYIEGSSAGSTPEKQRMALYSLNSVAKVYRNTLLPVVSAIAQNPSEDRNVRIAAICVMMTMEPSMVHFQKLATSTWYEKDTEFQKFVYTTLKSLAEIEQEEQPNISANLYNIAEKARVVLPLAKPVATAFSSTHNYFTAEWLKDLQVGYHAHTAYTISHYNTMYGKIEYFMENLNFTPLEYAISIQGIGQFTEKLNKIFGAQGQSTLDKIHPEWREIVASLGIKQSESSPFGISAWAKMVDDVQVVLGFGSQDIENVVKHLQPGSLKQKMCGRHPINMVKINNLAPTEILIPSDMGLPIVIDVQMPSVLSAKGEINVQCSSPLPEVSISLAGKSDVAFTGYAGTICPFTKEIVAAGINQQWSVNYPTKVSAKVEMGKLQVKLSPSEEMHQSVDLYAYSVKPFATVRPLFHADVSPIMAHQNTKVIKSQGQRTTTSFPTIDQYFGIDNQLVINTETDIRDRKSLIDHLALYKYNPVNAVLFSWTSTAVTRNGMPSARFHEVRMVYNPSSSSTKEIEADITFGLAHKSQSKGLKAVSYTDQQQQKLEQSMQQLGVESGVGINAHVNVAMKGSQPRTFNYVISAGQGRQGTSQKWNLHLENKNGMSVCVDGSMDLPSLAIRDFERLQSENVQFNYRNTIGFGQTCQEHSIRITGKTNVSQEQKQRMQQSEDVKQCIKSTNRAQELQSQLLTSQVGSQEYQQTQKEHQQTVEKKIAHCQQAIQKMSTLDQVQFSVEYTPIPQYAQQYVKTIDTAVKAYLLPYVAGYERSSSQQNQFEVDLRFNSQLETVDMILREEDGTTKYSNIRLPAGLRTILPLHAGESFVRQVSQKIHGGPVYPKCYIGDAAVKTFDNKTYSYHLDDCYHVLAADCSKQTTHAVLAKLVNGKKHVQIFTHGSKVTLKPAGGKEYEINVDGKRVRIGQNQKQEVKSQDGQYAYNIYRSADNILVVETPYNRVIYDAQTVEIEGTYPSGGKYCGLCGDKNGDKRADVRNAKGITSSPQTSAISFRIQSDSCSSLSSQKQALVQQESQASRTIVKSSVSQILQGQLRKCSQRKHVKIWKEQQLCISRVPVVECGGACAPKALVEKRLSFTCLPATRERVIRHYEAKVRRGELLPELRNMDEHFTSDLVVPVTCGKPVSDQL